MSQLNLIKDRIDQISRVKGLTDTFEQIAIIKIKEIKDRVEISKKFFDDIWRIYIDLRIIKTKKDKSLMTSISKAIVQQNKVGNAYVLVSSTSGLSGSINRQVVNYMLPDVRKDLATSNRTGVFAIGKYGYTLLSEKQIKITKEFDMPPQDNVDEKMISQIITDLSTYQHIFVYYPEFFSIGHQQEKKIEITKEYLNEDLGITEEKENLITPENYIFEPSVEFVIEHFESIMMGIAMGQIILESKLSQYASRLIAMDMASQRAGDIYELEENHYNMAVRDNRDKSIKELFGAMKVREVRI